MHLAGVLRLIGRWEEAENLYRRSLAEMSELLGDDHLTVSMTRQNFAKLLWEKGDWPEAETLCRAALAAREDAARVVFIGGT
jgi:Fe2+ or Zn2+ uptake regulation protein